MGTFGLITTPLGFRALTIECPWLDNKTSVSCIPNGAYDVVWTYSPKFGRSVYVLLDVPGRSGIRFHPGNVAGNTEAGLASDFEGCIGLGLRLGVIQNQRALLISAPALVAFEDHMERQPFRLEVR